MTAKEITDSRDLPSPGDKLGFVEALFDRIAPKYDLVNRVMTFGLDQRWRSRVIDALMVDSARRVLDLATGTGDFLKAWERRGVFAVGVDLAYRMMQNLSETYRVVQAQGEALPFASASFDAVSSGFAVRNFADLDAVFSEVARVLRPGGLFGVVEVAVPEAPLVKQLHGMYFNRIVPTLGGMISGDRQAYRYLPSSVAYLPDPKGMVKIFVKSGFLPPQRFSVGFGAAQVLIARRRGR